jgi:hypothetical protein
LRNSSGEGSLKGSTGEGSLDISSIGKGPLVLFSGEGTVEYIEDEDERGREEVEEEEVE